MKSESKWNNHSLYVYICQLIVYKRNVTKRKKLIIFILNNRNNPYSNYEI